MISDRRIIIDYSEGNDNSFKQTQIITKELDEPMQGFIKFCARKGHGHLNGDKICDL